MAEEAVVMNKFKILPSFRNTFDIKGAKTGYIQTIAEGKGRSILSVLDYESNQSDIEKRWLYHPETVDPHLDGVYDYIICSFDMIPTDLLQTFVNRNQPISDVFKTENEKAITEAGFFALKLKLAGDGIAASYTIMPVLKGRIKTDWNIVDYGIQVYADYQVNNDLNHQLTFYRGNTPETRYKVIVAIRKIKKASIDSQKEDDFSTALALVRYPILKIDVTMNLLIGENLEFEPAMDRRFFVGNGHDLPYERYVEIDHLLIPNGSVSGMLKGDAYTAKDMENIPKRARPVIKAENGEFDKGYIIDVECDINGAASVLVNGTEDPLTLMTPIRDFGKQTKRGPEFLWKIFNAIGLNYNKFYYFQGAIRVDGKLYHVNRVKIDSLIESTDDFGAIHFVFDDTQKLLDNESRRLTYSPSQDVAPDTEYLSGEFFGISIYPMANDEFLYPDKIKHNATVMQYQRLNQLVLNDIELSTPQYKTEPYTMRKKKIAYSDSTHTIAVLGINDIKMIDTLTGRIIAVINNQKFGYAHYDEVVYLDATESFVLLSDTHDVILITDKAPFIQVGTKLSTGISFQKWEFFAISASLGTLFVTGKKMITNAAGNQILRVQSLVFKLDSHGSLNCENIEEVAAFNEYRDYFIERHTNTFAFGYWTAKNTVVHDSLFNALDYSATKGTKVKVNSVIRDPKDQNAYIVATEDEIVYIRYKFDPETQSIVYNKKVKLLEYLDKEHFTYGVFAYDGRIYRYKTQGVSGYKPDNSVNTIDEIVIDRSNMHPDTTTFKATKLFNTIQFSGINADNYFIESVLVEDHTIFFLYGDTTMLGSLISYKPSLANNQNGGFIDSENNEGSMYPASIQQLSGTLLLSSSKMKHPPRPIVYTIK